MFATIGLWTEILLTMTTAVLAIGGVVHFEKLSSSLVAAVQDEIDLKQCGALSAASANLHSAQEYLAELDPEQTLAWAKAETDAQRAIPALAARPRACPVKRGVGIGIHREQNYALALPYPNWVMRFVRDSTGGL